MRKKNFIFSLIAAILIVFASCDSTEKGPKGDRGPQGIQGEKGDVGPQGPQGIAGKDGKDGVDGKDGAIGPQGIQGIQGEKGEKGDKGDPGKDGEVILSSKKDNLYRIVTSVNTCNNDGEGGKILEVFEDSNKSGSLEVSEDTMIREWSFCYGDPMYKAFQQYLEIEDYLNIRFENKDAVRNGVIVKDEYLVEVYIDEKMIWDFYAIKER